MAGMYPDNQTISLFGEEITWPGVDENGKFTNGDFNNPLKKPSYIPADTINLILDNLGNLISYLGGVPNNDETEQLKDVLKNSLDMKADLESPELTGTPTAPTAAVKNNSGQIATTAYADRAGHPVNSYYTQYAGSNNNFNAAEEPAALFGGTWSMMWNTEGTYFQTEGGGTLARTNGLQTDAIRNIIGAFVNNTKFNQPGAFAQWEGALYPKGTYNTAVMGGSSNSYASADLGFDASRCFPNNIDTVNHPKNRLIRVWKHTA